MTVYIEKPAVNLREELASLRNQGGYQEQQFYFDSLVTNGTFDANLSGWTDGSTGTGSTSWNASGWANVYGVDSSNRGILWAVVPTVVGKAYVCSISTASLTSGNSYPIIGTSANGSQLATFGNFNSVQTQTKTFVATTTTTYVTLNSQGTMSFDNISVFETDGTDVVHRLPKGWKPKDVFEDGLLQREGAANDYEVVYDGFDYFVKPTVAPSATTQTCVIGVKA